MDLVTRVSAYIEEYSLLVPGEQVVVGVSGGPDSLCLLEILCSLGYKPVVAHFDHKLRSESGAEAEYVAQLAGDKGLQFELGQPESGKLETKGRSLEGAAREERYKFLLRIAIKYDLNTVAVGHTSDDQVETVLMHFLRGAGLKGLRGMQPKTSMEVWEEPGSSGNVSLIRPLLKSSGEEVNSYCEISGLQPIHDPSNQDNSFLRNRVRNQLLPMLEEFNPAIRQAILRTSRTMTRQSDLNDELLNSFHADYVLEEDLNYSFFELEGFQMLHDSLQREFVNKIAARISDNSEQLDYQAILRGVNLFCGEEIGRMDLAAGVEAFRFSRLGLIRKLDAPVATKLWPQMRVKQPIHLKSGDCVQLNERWEVVCSKRKISESEFSLIKNNLDENVAFLSADLLSPELHIRSFKQGDWFQPLGMAGRTKVADFFTNVKVPSVLRDNWPLLVHGDTIAWVMGLRIAERFRLEEGSVETAVIELVRTGKENETEV